MNKLMLIFLSALFLTACADKEQYQQAVLTEMRKEKDVADYKIDPEEITKCVVDTSSRKMPGYFPFDPNRLTAYQNYTKMLMITQTKDPKAAIDELRTAFGSPQALAAAHENYAESVAECFSSAVTSTEQTQQEGEKPAQTSAPVPEAPKPEAPVAPAS